MTPLATVRGSLGRWTQSLPLPSVAIAIFEITILGGATYLLLSTKHAVGPDFPDWIGLAIAIAFIAAIATSARKSVRRQRVLPSRRIAIPMPVVLGLLASLGFLAVFLADASWTGAADDGMLLEPLELALAWALCLCMTRSVAARLSDLHTFKRRVLVVGSGARAREIARLATVESSARFKPVGFINDISSSVVGGVTEIDSLLRTAKELRASEIVVATDDRRGVPVDPLLQCKAEGINVVDFVAFLEREGGRIDLSALQPSWFLYSDGFGPKPFARRLKRGLDVIVGAAILLFVLPLLLLAVIAIQCESRGPVFLRQKRVGWRGRRFYILRLRLAPVEPTGMGLAHPRSKLGSLVCKLRIDLLPQFWNVVRGDMSLVGPRADRPAIAERLTAEIPFYCRRQSMRPGITGWAQVNYPYGAQLEDIRQKLSYDLYYLKNWGFYRDLWVLMQAFGFMLHP